jgi:hypothetical protein
MLVTHSTPFNPCLGSEIQLEETEGSPEDDEEVY